MGHVIKDALFARDIQGDELTKLKKAENEASAILALHRNFDKQIQ